MHTFKIHVLFNFFFLLNGFEDAKLHFQSTTKKMQRFSNLFISVRRCMCSSELLMMDGKPV